MTTKARTVTNRQAVPLIANQEPFKNDGSTFRGEVVTGRVGWTGYLPSEYADQIDSDQPTYVVWSYATPIAWFGPQGWTVPEARYSWATSRHQTLVRSAVEK